MPDNQSLDTEKLMRMLQENDDFDVFLNPAVGLSQTLR